MASQQSTKTLLGITPAQNQLKGPYVDMTAPGILGGYKPAGLASNASHDYIYPCNDDRFEEVNVYYHLDRTQRKIQELGFTGNSGVMNRAIPAHAHYFSGCNAFFDPVNGGVHFGDFDGPPEACFGPSPPNPQPPLYDSGEDADVVVHEYGHAIHDNQVPGWSFGPYPAAEQAAAMGEGFGDFLAGVMNNDSCVGEYISFGEVSCGGSAGLRSLEDPMVYPGGYQACPNVDYDGDTVAETNEPHCGGLVWGAVLWDMVQNIGNGSATQGARDTGLKLVLEAQFFLDQTATFNEAAAAICMADNMLFGGANAADISAAFSGRGISTVPCGNTDAASYFIRIPHTYSGDLAVRIVVGPDPLSTSPPCAISVPAPPTGFGGIEDWYVGYDSPATCAGFLPPTLAQPWWVVAEDSAPFDVGTIQAFEILLVGGTRCVSADTPVAIPDNGPKVMAKIDCSSRVTAVTPTPSPTPSPNAFGNVDCTGAINAVDALKVLRHVAGLPVTQIGPEPDACTNIGAGPVTGGGVQGDVDCSGGSNAIDALKVLRHTAGLPVTQIGPEPDACPNIGTG
jgi:hypothetical protein